ncbi:hypothetical protein BV898_08936 [Hypsibius exemplaris]|uniref:Receptor ligand binding region domain-containing protein n=1 Tax=Hypsibius exemplaris TaxID=2072580 RepID=A0A1W0WNY4_HYPEX|nr:hypothetical protein BV898_08936 [Hypsibius exemplaris]
MGLFVFLGLLFFGASCSADPIVIRIGSLGPHESRENITISTVPYQMAAKDFGRRTHDKFNLTLTSLRTRLAETGQIDCLYRADDADQTIAEWFYQQRDEEGRRFEITPLGLIQTGCIDRSTVHLLAAEWNILSITSVASQRDPKIQFAIGSTSLFLGSVSVSTYVDTIRNLLRIYRWDSVYMLLDDASAGVYGGTFEELLDGAATMCIFLGHAARLRRLMLTAHRLNMTNGEYVYVAMETLINSPVRLGILDWHYNLTDDAVAKVAFRSLLVVHRHLPASSPATIRAREVFRRRLAVEYNFSTSAGVMAQANLAGIPLKDAHSLAKLLLLNRSVHLDADEIMEDFFIDSYGQRRSDLAISYFGGSLTVRMPFLVKYANASGDFTSIGRIEWMGGKPWPPPNVPRCGYLGNDTDCQPNVSGKDWTGGAVAVCLILTTATWIIFRKLRFEHTKTWWKLDENFLRFPQPRPHRSFCSLLRFPCVSAVMRPSF